MGSMIVRTLLVGPLQTNCYLVACSNTGLAMAIDPGGSLPRITSAIEQLGVRLERIVLTHFHFDHTLAAEGLRTQTGAPIAIHELDGAAFTDPPELFRYFGASIPSGVIPDLLLGDAQGFVLGDLEVEVLHTPGHSPGGISLYLPAEGAVFSGDALFREGIGRTDFPGSDHGALLQSIRDKLLSLPDETIVYPGHGPSTTIGHERRHNPWVATGAS